MDWRFLHLTEFAFVWGPIELPEPAYSFDDHWVSQIYTPGEIGEAILAVPGTRLAHPASPNWNAWEARWESADGHILFQMIACPFDPSDRSRPGLTEAWGGSPFEAHCSLDDLLFVWRRIRDRCPGVWLHDTDSRMYSPESFASAFTGQPE